MSALQLGLLYFAAVLAAGFALGALRGLVLAPRIGELRAVLLELPLMLGIAWMVCGWLLRRRNLSRADRTVMGATAFLSLMLAEALLDMAFGTPLAAHLRSYAEAPQLAGLAGQVLFGLFPLLHPTAHGPAVSRR